MPTFDGGHCFLTTLIPIDSKHVVERNGLKYSHVQLVREALSVLPTAHQSPDTGKLACNSPFARCTKTHFARLVVLDDVVFNGRMPSDAVLNAIEQKDPTIPDQMDSLPGPYLFFNADFDAPRGTDAELRDWLRGVWTKMRDDLCPVFEHCFKFKMKVTDADSFADYMIAHQLDTTMPFNDYWTVPPAPLLPTVSFVPAAGVLVVSLVIVTCISRWLWELFHPTGAGIVWWVLGIVVGVLLALGITIYAVYLLVMRAGLKPFPMAPNSDLPSILKGLYLQRQLIPEVARLQGKSPEVLFREMGAFLSSVQVDNLQAPTQAPGTIGK